MKSATRFLINRIKNEMETLKSIRITCNYNLFNGKISLDTTYLSNEGVQKYTPVLDNTLKELLTFELDLDLTNKKGGYGSIFCSLDANNELEVQITAVKSIRLNTGHD